MANLKITSSLKTFRIDFNDLALPNGTSSGSYNIEDAFIEKRGDYVRLTIVGVDKHDLVASVTEGLEGVLVVDEVNGVAVTSLTQLWELLCNARMVYDVEEWASVPESSILNEYYSSVEIGNPSGAKNLKSITFLKNEVAIIKTSFTYDSDNYILTKSSVFL